MVKVFISQPMRGKTKEEILSRRNEVMSIVKNNLEALGQDIEIMDTYFNDYDPNNGCVPLKYLAKSLEFLADADLAIFIDDFYDYRGCKIEYKCAQEYGIKYEVYQ